MPADWTMAPPAGMRASMLVKIARMYHEEGLRQPEIAARLHMSQSRVSRLLKEAGDTGIVRTVVVPPPGVHTDLEDGLRARFGLTDAVVADSAPDDQRQLERVLGAAAAVYLEATMTGGERIGVSSWSATLLAMVTAMSVRAPRTAASAVVQLQGGVGAPGVQAQATRLVEGLARVTGARPTVFPVPGLVASAEARDALLGDDVARELLDAWPTLDTALVGIGSLAPSDLLRSSGNAVSEAEQERLRAAGAVGDVCLRFFDVEGASVSTGLDDRVLAIPATMFRRIPRRIGIAGGRRKQAAIRAAARGEWIDVLVTDPATAAAVLT